MTRNHQKQRTEIMNAVLEAIMIVLCYLIMFFLYAYRNIGLQRMSRTLLMVSLAFFLSMLVFRGVYGAFHVGVIRKRLLLSNQFCKLIFSDAITFLLLQIMNTNPANPEANPTFRLWDINLLLTFVILIVQVLFCAVLMEVGYVRYYQLNPPRKCLLIVTSQAEADHLAARYQAYPKNYRLTEAITESCTDWRETIEENEMVVLGDLPLELKNKILAFCYEKHVMVYSLAQAMDVVCSTAKSPILLDTAFVDYSGREPGLLERGFKRGFDIVFSILLLIILSPLLLVITVVLALSRNGSVIFTQDRITRDGRIFRIMKFRTMYIDSEQYVSMSKNDERITPFGRFLRKYRLDELPQLINIIKGDMSIVGPRPEIIPNVEKYLEVAPEFRYRERMRAGITGFAQLEGAYDTSPKDKAMLDLMYIEKFSISLDAKLILRTFTVFFRKDNEGFSKEKTNLISLRTQAKKERTCG